ncbi:outer membrane protein [Acinetobacter sp. ANC 5383]
MGLNITDLNADKISFTTSPISYDLSSDDKQNLAVGAIAFGWNLEPSLHVPVRTELEYSAQQDHQFNSKSADPYYINDAVKLQQQAVMWNTYFDWKNSSKFTPYFAVGVGATRIHAKGVLSDNSVSGTFSEDFAAISKTDFNFIWSVGIGTSYRITPNLAANFSYKYIDSGKLKQYYNDFGTDAESSYNLRAHNLALGLRYSF